MTAFYELRQYPVLPGKMDEWVKIMEDEIRKNLVLKAKQATAEAFQSQGVDMIALYLDDGIIAGGAQEVKFFLEHLIRDLDAIGLKFRPDKSWVIPSATVTNVTRDCFRTMSVRQTPISIS